MNLTPSALRTSTTARPAVIFVMKPDPFRRLRRKPPRLSSLLLRADQRTIALVERTKRFLSRDRGHDVINVPLARGFFGLLDLEQIEVAQHTAVDAHLAVLGGEIVHRCLAHLG